jgi:hypothetical protein
MRKMIIFLCFFLVTFGVFGETGQSVRETKRFILYLTPIGLDFTTMTTAPLAVGLFVVPNLLLEAEYGQICVFCTGNNLNQFQKYGGGLRYFFGDSFNVLTNVYQFNWLFDECSQTHAGKLKKYSFLYRILSRKITNPVFYIPI